MASQDMIDLDTILLDDEGDLRSDQPKHLEYSPSKPELPPKLSTENFRLVKHQASKVHHAMNIRDRSQAFQDYNSRMFEQRIKPRWLPPTPCPPLLPGSTCFPSELHLSWNKIVAKYERKLHKTIVISLPTAIGLLEEKIHLSRNNGINLIKSGITDPDQRRRAELVFIKLAQRTTPQSPKSITDKR
jgi:hypothetical protein